jgi:hypothetical protein
VTTFQLPCREVQSAEWTGEDLQASLLWVLPARPRADSSLAPPPLQLIWPRQMLMET